MRTCVVLQPFDRGAFDKRYDEVFALAIAAAGLEPYRVDRDLSASIPIESIEKNIRDADVCLADISNDNPNVCYEAGFAFACGKEVVLVCKEGSTFPFDLRHRTIIPYATQSPGDFKTLETAITGRLKAIAHKTKMIAAISPVKPKHGLTAAETLALAFIMEDRLSHSPGLPPRGIADDMGKLGFTNMAEVLALEGLAQKELAEVVQEQEYNGGTYNVYVMTPAGIKWCMANQDQFKLTHAPTVPSLAETPPSVQNEDEDIPF
jgi:hypothetical protein